MKNFSFDDLKSLDDKDIREVLKNIESNVLVGALKYSDKKVLEKVLNNLSSRAGEMLQSDIDDATSIDQSKSLAAKREIVFLVEKLVENGSMSIEKYMDKLSSAKDLIKYKLQFESENNEKVQFQPAETKNGVIEVNIDKCITKIEESGKYKQPFEVRNVFCQFLDSYSSVVRWKDGERIAKVYITSNDIVRNHKYFENLKKPQKSKLEEDKKPTAKSKNLVLEFMDQSMGTPIKNLGLIALNNKKIKGQTDEYGLIECERADVYGLKDGLQRFKIDINGRSLPEKELDIKLNNGPVIVAVPKITKLTVAINPSSSERMFVVGYQDDDKMDLKEGHVVNTNKTFTVEDFPQEARYLVVKERAASKIYDLYVNAGIVEFDDDIRKDNGEKSQTSPVRFVDSEFDKLKENEFKQILVEEITPLHRDIISSGDENLKLLLNTESFLPLYKVKIRGQMFYSCNIFKKAGNGYLCAILYFIYNGKWVAQLFYKSNSSGFWRAGFYIRNEYSRINWFKGAHYTQHTKPFKEFDIFLDKYEKNVFISEIKKEIVDTVLHKCFWFKIENFVNNKVKITEFEKLPSLDNMHKYSHDDLVKVIEGVNYPEGFLPDFSKKPFETYSLNHNMLGKVMLYCYETKLYNVPVIFEMAVEDNDINKVWVNRVFYKNSQMNIFCCPEKLIDTKCLTSKPIEYSGQVPKDYNYPSDNTYCDITSLLSHFKPIREFKEKVLGIKVEDVEKTVEQEDRIITVRFVDKNNNPISFLTDVKIGEVKLDNTDKNGEVKVSLNSLSTKGSQNIGCMVGARGCSDITPNELSKDLIIKQIEKRESVTLFFKDDKDGLFKPQFNCYLYYLDNHQNILLRESLIVSDGTVKIDCVQAQKKIAVGVIRYVAWNFDGIDKQYYDGIDLYTCEPQKYIQIEPDKLNLVDNGKSGSDGHSSDDTVVSQNDTVLSHDDIDSLIEKALNDSDSSSGKDKSGSEDFEISSSGDSDKITKEDLDRLLKQVDLGDSDSSSDKNESSPSGSKSDDDGLISQDDIKNMFGETADDKKTPRKKNPDIDINNMISQEDIENLFRPFEDESEDKDKENK